MHEYDDRHLHNENKRRNVMNRARIICKCIFCICNCIFRLFFKLHMQYAFCIFLHILKYQVGTASDPNSHKPREQANPKLP